MAPLASSNNTGGNGRAPIITCYMKRKDSSGSFHFLLLKRELFESLHIMVLDLKGSFFPVIMSLNLTNKRSALCECLFHEENGSAHKSVSCRGFFITACIIGYFGSSKSLMKVFTCQHSAIRWTQMLAFVIGMRFPIIMTLMRFSFSGFDDEVHICTSPALTSSSSCHPVTPPRLTHPSALRPSHLQGGCGSALPQWVRSARHQDQTPCHPPVIIDHWSCLKFHAPELNDYMPVTLTSVVMMSFNKLVLEHLKDITGPPAGLPAVCSPGK